MDVNLQLFANPFSCLSKTVIGLYRLASDKRASIRLTDIARGHTGFTSPSSSYMVSISNTNIERHVPESLLYIHSLTFLMS